MNQRFPVVAVLFLLVLSPALLADNAEAKAVEAIERLGGRVYRDTKKEGQPVTGLDFSRCEKLTDAALTDVAMFTQLRSVDLRGCEEVTDAGVKHFGACKQLEYLISGPAVVLAL
jgi:hypothetical protein